LDSIITALQTIITNQEAEKEEMRNHNSNGRIGPVAERILPLPGNNTRLEWSNSWEGHIGGHTTPFQKWNSQPLTEIVLGVGSENVGSISSYTLFQ